MKRILIGLIVLALLGGGGFYLFERHERAGLAGAATEACGDDDLASTTATLPFDLPVPEGGAVLRSDTQGATTVAFASVPGGRDDIVDQRDAVLEQLKAKGYTVAGTDQEPSYEAEAQLEGTHTGTLRVKPLCEGQLEVRYKIED